MTDISRVNEEPSVDRDSSLDEYFANKPRKEIGDECMKLVDDYYNYLQNYGRMRILRRAFDYYFRGFQRGARIWRTGKQDEYSVMQVNEFRNILLHLIVGVTSNRLTFEPQATNTDFKSQAQTKISTGVVDHYNRVLSMDEYAKKVTELGVVFGEGFVSLEWDANAGPDFGVGPEGEIMKQGDIVIDRFDPTDVVRDITLENFDERQWIITRKWKNKYDLMARYPDLADKIKMLSTDYELLRHIRWSMAKRKETDYIPVWTFYHEKSPAVPNGRMVEFLDSDIITIDGPLPYREIPVYRMTPDEQIKSPFGYTVAYDLMPLQEALDGLYSIILTNQSTFGVQNIAMPTGANINVNALADGLNLITYDPKHGAPQALNLVQTPAEIFDMIKNITERMETISGLNSVVRGNPEASLKSGAALALVASQAIQFNSGLAQSYAKLAEKMGTAIINLLKDYANTPRMIAISGKSNRTYMREFTGKDIADIDRVTVDMGNPLSRTVAGKLQIADALLGAQMVKTPEQYISVATTGRLEQLVENPQSQLMLIKSENEMLGEGKPQTALVTDDHRLHILEHMVVLNSPEAREEGSVVQATLGHIQEHINHLNMGDPTILGINNQPMPGGSQNMMPLPEGTGGEISETMSAPNPMTGEGAAVNMPNQPSNPLTGEAYNPAQGAGVPPMPKV